jgi:MSHA biogenesis protein MshI
MFGRTLQQKVQVGIYHTAEGIAVAEMELSDDSQPRLKSVEYITSSETSERLRRLHQYIKQRGLKKQPCVVVLEDTHYNLIQMPVPPVEESELTSALRWSVKDHIDYPVEEAVIDVFRVPVQEHREAKVYVVATPRDEILQTIDFIRKTGLILNTIDIEELSLGNIVEQMEGQERGVAVLHFGQQHGSISLYRDSALYLSRKIDTGLKRIEEIQMQGTSPGAAEQIYESILLELQRSLDFYESEFARAPISRLVVAPRHPVLQGFCDYVGSHSGLAIELINLAQIYTDTTELNDENQANCLLAIAAASRKLEAAA